MPTDREEHDRRLRVPSSPSGTMDPVSWRARRQTCAAASTGEAEVVALGEALRKMLGPTSSLLGQIQRHDGDDLCVPSGSDSAMALIAVDKGITPGMKYLRKNQRISIASLADCIASSGTHMLKVDSEVNIADLLTKALPIQRFEFLAELMGMRDYACPGDPPRITSDLLIQGRTSPRPPRPAARAHANERRRIRSPGRPFPRSEACGCQDTMMGGRHCPRAS